MHLPCYIQDTRLRIKKNYYDKINLSSNELTPSDKLGELQQDFYKFFNTQVDNFRKYTFIEDVRTNFAAHLGVNSACLTITTGSDCAIFYLLTLLKHRYHRVLLQSPNYFNYERYAKLLDLSLAGASLDADIFIAQLRKTFDAIVVVTNPNGFDGRQWSLQILEEIIAICKQQNNFCIIDEAYADFADQPLTIWQENYHCLAIIKTYSKSYASSGIRVAYVLASNLISDALKKFGIENSLGQVQLAYLTFIMLHQYKFEQLQMEIKQIRTELYNWICKALPKYQATKSQGNFICIRFDDEQSYQIAQQDFLQHDIIIKNINEHASFRHALRITIPSRTHIHLIKQLLRRSHD